MDTTNPILHEDFIVKKLSHLRRMPAEWQLPSDVIGYQLNLKMCQIKMLRFAFQWKHARNKSEHIHTDGDPVSILDNSDSILALDLSLNDLHTLEHDGLCSFRQLRSLDASLNQIDRFVGVEVAKHLYALNLSHNFIKYLYGLEQSQSLGVLNLAMNRIEDISYMPTLSNLVTIHLNNNRLRSLEGIQNLSHLKELFAHGNYLVDILPVAGSFRLTTLNVSDNRISSLRTTLEVLRGLKRLTIVWMHGNPVDKEDGYIDDITERTGISQLDNVCIRHDTDRPTTETPHRYTHSTSRDHTPRNNVAAQLETIKESARQAFLEQLSQHKRKTDENVNFLQKRVIALQKEYKDYEAKTHRDIDECMRYFDRVNLSDLGESEVSRLKANMTPSPSPTTTPIHSRHTTGTADDQ